MIYLIEAEVSHKRHGGIRETSSQPPRLYPKAIISSVINQRSPVPH
jgi:hypothetical protein